jgi:hypothetical protein
LEKNVSYNWTDFSSSGRTPKEFAMQPGVFVKDCKKWEQRRMDLQQARQANLKSGNTKKYKQIIPHKQISLPPSTSDFGFQHGFLSTIQITNHNVNIGALNVHNPMGKS